MPAPLGRSCQALTPPGLAVISTRKQVLQGKQANVSFFMNLIIFNELTMKYRGLMVPSMDINSTTWPQIQPLLRPSHGLCVACRTLPIKTEM